MRILLLATDVFTHGGIGRYTYDVAAVLGGLAGPENVDVASFFDWGFAGREPAAATQPFRLLTPGGAKATPAARLRFVATALAAARRQGPYDLVFCNHAVMAPLAWWLRARYGTPYWVACHSIEVWWRMAPWEKWTLRRADRVLPVSRFTAAVLQERQGVPAGRIELVVPILRDAWGEALAGAAARAPRRDGLCLLSVASLAAGMEYKGIDTVLRAMPELLADFPTLRYVVAGTGSGRGRLEELARELGVSAAVRFTGEVTQAELLELFHRCDVFVLPSRGQTHGGQWGGEGFGRVYIEAAWAGKPVVGSRTGGAAEAILDGRNGYQVDPARPEAVAEGVGKLLADPARRAAMGATGQAWVRATFSEGVLRARLAELLRRQGLA